MTRLNRIPSLTDILFVWLCIISSHAVASNWQGAWSGTIGKAEITACFLVPDGSSRYRYKRYQKDIELTAMSHNVWGEVTNGVITDIWVMNDPQGNTMDGEWQNLMAGRRLPIHLKRMAEVSSVMPCQIRSQNFVMASGTNLLKDVTIGRNGKTLVAVGFAGKIKYSADGGQNWIGEKSGTENNLHSVVATPRGSFVVVGDGGTILRSVDDGVRWSMVHGPTQQPLLKVIVGSDAALVAVGEEGVIARSSDDGATWNLVKSGTDKMLVDVAVAPNGVLVAVGGQAYWGAKRLHVVSVIVRSIDGGVSWSRVDVGTEAQLSSVVAMQNDLWVAVGEVGTIVRSIDGGVNWSTIGSGTKYRLNKVITVPNGILVAVGEAGTILRSVDNGASWTAIENQTDGSIHDITTTFLGGLAAVDQAGNVLYSMSNGATWTMFDSGAEGGLDALVAEADGS